MNPFYREKLEVQHDWTKVTQLSAAGQAVLNPGLLPHHLLCTTPPQSDTGEMGPCLWGHERTRTQEDLQLI